ncbi:hypothetical protein LI291_10420 [Intestinibacillus massiliensis]|uniref:hypothetical protein n=1 Tax=Intestinibacillus massiliensis TaxID=1871029 RepID=UPI000B361DDB|nr:hypothetical protein [Intestinibacillus massiliensis]MCB6366585.1 hypothetical protein [Intestinibacillus massiliensis]
MYYIRICVGGCIKYLYNGRLAVFQPEYAKKFKTPKAALQYMKGKPVAQQNHWWIVCIEGH